TTLIIGNSATSANGILRINGATINPGTGNTANMLLSVSDTATGNMVIQNRPGTTSGTQTLTLNLGITTGNIYVASGRTLTVSSFIGQVTAGSGFTKLGSGTMN